MLKQGSHVLPQAKRALAKLSGSNGSLSLSRSSVHDSDTGARKVPFLLMTNGGGVTDAERRSALSKDLGVPVSTCLRASSSWHADHDPRIARRTPTGAVSYAPTRLYKGLERPACACHWWTGRCSPKDRPVVRHEASVHPSGSLGVEPVSLGSIPVIRGREGLCQGASSFPSSPGRTSSSGL